MAFVGAHLRSLYAALAFVQKALQCYRSDQDIFDLQIATELCCVQEEICFVIQYELLVWTCIDKLPYKNLLDMCHVTTECNQLVGHWSKICIEILQTCAICRAKDSSCGDTEKGTQSRSCMASCPLTRLCTAQMGLSQ